MATAAERKADYIRQEKERVREGRLHGLGRLALFYNSEFSVEDVNNLDFIPAGVDSQQKLSAFSRGKIVYVKWKGYSQATAVRVFARVETGRMPGFTGENAEKIFIAI